MTAIADSLGTVSTVFRRLATSDRCAEQTVETVITYLTQLPYVGSSMASDDHPFSRSYFGQLVLSGEA